MKWLALVFALLASTAGLAAPTEVEAEYKVFRNGILIGRVTESYVRKGDHYSIESKTTSDGVLRIFLEDTLVLTSEGRFGAGGLEPQRFKQRQAGNRGRDIRATFDWEAGLMHSEFKGESKDVELPRGTQDRLSLMYPFMNLVPRGETVEMHMSNGRGVERYTYRMTEEVPLKTPAGDFDTLHYERVTTEPTQSKAQVWLARDRFNFPVRIIFDDPKGVRLEQAIVSLQTR